MRNAAAWAGVIAGLSALGCYPVLVHSTVASGQAGAFATALALVQAAITGWTISRFSPKGRWVALAAMAVLFGLSWHSARNGLLAASGVGHAVIYVGLLCLFAGTLAAGREPLITVMARRIRGSLTEEMEAYTRRVTWAWCFFFAGQLLVSLFLFLFASDTVWSFFINVLDLPLVVTMFLLEYAYRLSRFWNYSHGSIADVIRVFGEQPER
jgi:uncharacterized membrane protein